MLEPGTVVTLGLDLRDEEGLVLRRGTRGKVQSQDGGLVTVAFYVPDDTPGLTPGQSGLLAPGVILRTVPLARLSLVNRFVSTQ